MASMVEFIPANEPVAIIIARSSAAAAAAADAVASGRPLVALIPHVTDWNNFGFYTSVAMRLVSADGAIAELEIEILFQGKVRSDDYLREVLGDANWRPISAVTVAFCSVLSDIRFYKEIVEFLGFARAVTVLRELGDAVVLRAEGVDQQRLALVDSPGFHQSALRSNEAFVAFRRGGKYLRRQPYPHVEDAAVSFTIEAQLPSADNAYQISFDFDSDELGRNRHFVLIGKNGAGKTQFFLSMIRSLQDGQPLSDSMPPKFNRLLVFSSVSSDLYPRSIAPWHGLDYAYHSMVGEVSDQLSSLTAALVDCFRDPGDVQFFEGSWFNPGGRFALLRRSLESIGLWSTVHLLIKEGAGDGDFGVLPSYQGRFYFPLWRLSGLNEQRKLLLTRAIDWTVSPVAFDERGLPRSLSSGEYAMLRFAAQAAAGAEIGCLFLFDEPETHLHPNYISSFMDMLHIVLAASRSVAIIATHSVYIVREVPRQRVRVVSVENREVSILKPRLQTYGASVDSISQFVFDDTSVKHRYQSTLIDWVNGLGPHVSIDQIIDEYGSSMNAETLAYVARHLKSRM